MLVSTHLCHKLARAQSAQDLESHPSIVELCGALTTEKVNKIGKHSPMNRVLYSNDVTDWCDMANCTAHLFVVPLVNFVLSAGGVLHLWKQR